MSDATIPNLSGVADPSVIDRKDGGKFKAEYINWARSLADIRDAAPGWMPDAAPDPLGNVVHSAPDGSGFLMMRWVHVSGTVTPGIPHAVMDDYMQAKDAISSRDISDAFVRGACKSAAAIFGYAWQMWSKSDPLVREGPTFWNEQQQRDLADLLDTADDRQLAAFGEWWRGPDGPGPAVKTAKMEPGDRRPVEDEASVAITWLTDRIAADAAKPADTPDADTAGADVPEDKADWNSPDYVAETADSKAPADTKESGY